MIVAILVAPGAPVTVEQVEAAAAIWRAGGYQVGSVSAGTCDESTIESGAVCVRRVSCRSPHVRRDGRVVQIPNGRCIPPAPLWPTEPGSWWTMPAPEHPLAESTSLGDRWLVELDGRVRLGGGVEVVAHELGHALGYGHQTGLMAPVRGAYGSIALPAM